MKNAALKSVIAIIVCFMVGALLCIITDILLDKIGYMKAESFKENSPWVILVVIIYRFIYNVIGCYVAAAMAPARPMRHAMIIGVIGLVLGTLGSIVMWDKAVAWYNISIILISVPCAYIGGQLYISKKER